MTRRLSRKHKDLACLRQFGLCAYCEETLSDAMQVDHMDENRINDEWANLACACGTCHANKTQHYRKKRNQLLNEMLANATRNKNKWDAEWAEDADHGARLPGWLQCRVSPMAIRLRHLIEKNKRRTSPPPIDFERFRFKPRGT